MMNQSLSFTPRGEADCSPFGKLPGWFGALLRLRGIETEEAARCFLNPRPEDLHDPFLLSGMEKAVSLLRDAVRRQDPILIWGDYDADGICAAAILQELLREEGADVSRHLPSRHTEGYGLHESGIREAAGTFRLLVTVDCGISAVQEVTLARSLGMKVIVTDHHALPPVLPEADAIVHPQLAGYPCPDLCGAGVALKICQALQGLPGAEKRLDLAALATVADVVPLRDENRSIVFLGLKALQTPVRPGLQALMNAAGVRDPQADDLAFRLAPRLNAAGRLGAPDPAADLLLSSGAEEAERLAEKLEILNAERRNLEQATTAQALSQVSSREDVSSGSALVVAGEWNPGIIGLTAGKLCEQFWKPAVALGIRGEQATGSCRSIPGVNIFEMLKHCEDLLIRFGGHAQAAGLTLRTDCIDAFRSRLNRVITDHCDETVFRRRLEYDMEAPFRSWSEGAVNSLTLLEPTGCGCPAPVFLLRGASVRSLRRVGRDGSHLQLSLLDQENTPVRGIAFSQGDLADRPWLDADLLYRPVVNSFRGNRSVEAQVFAMSPAL